MPMRMEGSRVPERADQVYDGLYVQGVPMIFYLANYAIDLLMLLIFITSLMSWFNPDPHHPVVKFLHALVDPLLHPLRTILPSNLGMDFSPMLALLVLWFLQTLLQRGLAS
jgi:YggT family protein